MHGKNVSGRIQDFKSTELRPKTARLRQQMQQSSTSLHTKQADKHLARSATQPLSQRSRDSNQGFKVPNYSGTTNGRPRLPVATVEQIHRTDARHAKFVLNVTRRPKQISIR